ncbi:hypothetical protein TTY48_38250 [Tsukamurella sp. TY48]|uniref:hypothetical protein n=1 Tax=Tsukamurella TaxID=2060 RepID=UPI001C7D814C|nr:hypothetical protein [Tsukamurella sp. TY48]GIZ99213.1 hypothetical protein TTY48_38250 [Tsukamurella sp. TY48]
MPLISRAESEVVPAALDVAPDDDPAVLSSASAVVSRADDPVAPDDVPEDAADEPVASSTPASLFEVACEGWPDDEPSVAAFPDPDVSADSGEASEPLVFASSLSDALSVESCAAVESPLDGAPLSARAGALTAANSAPQNISAPNAIRDAAASQVAVRPRARFSDRLRPREFPRRRITLPMAAQTTTRSTTAYASGLITNDLY